MGGSIFKYFQSSFLIKYSGKSPWYTCFPSDKIIPRSQIDRASSKEWVIYIIIALFAFLYSLRKVNTSFLLLISRPEVGSSKTRIELFIAIIPARATFLFSPPLRSKGFLCLIAEGIKPTKFNAS